MAPRRRRNWRLSDRAESEKPAIPGLDYENALSFETEEAVLCRTLVTFYKQKLVSAGHRGLVKTVAGNVEGHVSKLVSEKSLEEIAAMLLQLYGEVPDSLAEFVSKDESFKDRQMNKQRLMAFYQMYAPPKASERYVEQLLSKYTLSKIQRGLRKKYNAKLELVNAEAQSVMSIGPSELAESEKSFFWGRAKTTAASPMSRAMPWRKKLPVYADDDSVGGSGASNSARFRLDSPTAQCPNMDGSQAPTPTLLTKGQVYYANATEQRSEHGSISSSVAIDIELLPQQPVAAEKTRRGVEERMDWGGQARGGLARGGQARGGQARGVWGEAPEDYSVQSSPTQTEAFSTAFPSTDAANHQHLPITWTNVIGGENFVAESTAEARMHGALEKLASEEGEKLASEEGEKSVWDSGASSIETVCWSREPQGVHWRVAADGEGYAIGLSYEDADADICSIDFGLWCHAYGHLAVFERGEGRGTFGKYRAGDQLAVKAVGDTISYWRNGALLYTSQQQPSFPLVVDTSFSSPGARAEALTIVVSDGE
jgi:hypothetical protein